MNNLEIIDNNILNNLANQNKALYRLIKKSAENKRTLKSSPKSHSNLEHSANSKSGHIETLKLNHLVTKGNQTQSGKKCSQHSPKFIHLVQKSSKKWDFEWTKKDSRVVVSWTTLPPPIQEAGEKCNGRVNRTGRRACPIHAGISEEYLVLRAPDNSKIIINNYASANRSQKQ